MIRLLFSGGLADSGVWVKSYHGSSDLLDHDSGSIGSPSVTDSGVFSQDGTLTSGGHGDMDGGKQFRPRKTSYLSAVNAPKGRTILSQYEAMQVQPGENVHLLLCLFMQTLYILQSVIYFFIL